MIVKTLLQWFKINGKNAFGCPLRLGLYLKVECMNLSETNFSRTAESQWLWQGAICHFWTSQFDKHWQQSQKQLQKYNIRDLPEGQNYIPLLENHYYLAFLPEN